MIWAAKEKQGEKTPGAAYPVSTGWDQLPFIPGAVKDYCRVKALFRKCCQTRAWSVTPDTEAVGVTHHTSFTSGTLAHMKSHQWGSIAHPLCLTGYSLAWLHYRNLASTTLLHLQQILSLSTINWYFGSQRLLHDYRARVAAFKAVQRVGSLDKINTTPAIFTDAEAE